MMPAIITQIRESGKLLIGKRAFFDIEGHWTQIYTTEFNTLGGMLFAAMSAIDMALWDIVGKNLGVPVYKLLGGRAIPAAKDTSDTYALRASSGYKVPRTPRPPTRRGRRRSSPTAQVVAGEVRSVL